MRIGILAITLLAGLISSNIFAQTTTKSIDEVAIPQLPNGVKYWENLLGNQGRGGLHFTRLGSNYCYLAVQKEFIGDWRDVTVFRNDSGYDSIDHNPATPTSRLLRYNWACFEKTDTELEVFDC